MLFMVHIKVEIPTNMETEEMQRLLVAERDMALKYQAEKKLVHLWRAAGEKMAITIWDAESHEDLHDLVSSLPMFKYLATTVTPLARHPSAA